MNGYRIAGTQVSKQQFIQHVNSGYVINVSGARTCKTGCEHIMYLEARLDMGDHYICNAGHDIVIKRRPHDETRKIRQANAY